MFQSLNRSSEIRKWVSTFSCLILQDIPRSPRVALALSLGVDWGTWRRIRQKRSWRASRSSSVFFLISVHVEQLLSREVTIQLSYRSIAAPNPPTACILTSSTTARSSYREPLTLAVLSFTVASTNSARPWLFSMSPRYFSSSFSCRWWSYLKLIFFVPKFNFIPTYFP